MPKTKILEEKWKKLQDEYLPVTGQGGTIMSQVVTCLSKIEYKWFNDGDVVDDSWCHGSKGNDLSSYANWLKELADENKILKDIFKGHEQSYWDEVNNAEDYQEWVYNMIGAFVDYIENGKIDLAKIPATGDIYECIGDYAYVEEEEEW